MNELFGLKALNSFPSLQSNPHNHVDQAMSNSWLITEPSMLQYNGRRRTVKRPMAARWEDVADADDWQVELAGGLWPSSDLIWNLPFFHLSKEGE